MSQDIRVAILDDHQSIIDGYLYRLDAARGIKVVATAMYGEELEPMLRDQPVDVLILDVNVPTSPSNQNPYPILHTLPWLVQTYPNLVVLVISVHNQRALIQSVMQAGASGYILKDDFATIRELGTVIQSIAEGGVHFSQEAHQQLIKRLPKDPSLSIRQLESLSLCAAYPGAKLSELAEKMKVSNSTMRNLLSEAYLRLRVNNRTAAIIKARELGLITPPDPRFEV